MVPWATVPPLPFLSVRSDATMAIVLAGLDPSGGSIVGFDPVRVGLVEGIEPAGVDALVSVDPAAVYQGVQLDWSEAAQRVLTSSMRSIMEPVRLVANRKPRLAPRGGRFPLLPPDAVSGFPVAESVIRRHRMKTPSEDSIRVSALFAVSTVRVSIEQAEEQFHCFGELYRATGRQMPDLGKLRSCFVGLQNTKTRVFTEVAGYAGTIHKAIAAGYRDRELRRYLAMETQLPEGLALAKLSFTLALLGQDTVCIDARLLSVLFPRPVDRAHFEKRISKQRGRISTKAIDLYEAAEDAFLNGNPYYRAGDAIGRARAQWMSWEGVGGKGAEHRVWLNLLPAV
jgi:hypothetical protein